MKEQLKPIETPDMPVETLDMDEMKDVRAGVALTLTSFAVGLVAAGISGGASAAIGIGLTEAQECC